MKFQMDEAIEILERTPKVLSNLLLGLPFHGLFVTKVKELGVLGNL